VGALRAVLLLCLALATGGSCKAQPSLADAGPTQKGSVPVLPPAARPYRLHLPAGWDRARPAPLVIFFHGYGSTGESSARGFGLDAAADAHGFVLAAPDGTIDAQGRRFWNATNACCNFENVDVDDVAYAAWLIDDVAGKVPIDRKRVYVAGHSNGGFMALRLACDLSPRIAAAVSLAGAAWSDPSRCNPTEPVSVLQIHGSADEIIRYGGGLVFDRPTRQYPGAFATAMTWVVKDRCTVPPAPAGTMLDFDGTVPGAETTETQASGCPPGISVDLWTVAGGSHELQPTATGLGAIWTWMAAHPKR
jgi:polyhydroxybutyrate depolymerase